ncbi:MAG: hypothetical protein E6I96_00120 [Chloroflexi bacterium]|nr:MAG: hypothetical protein E6I96_00120 [Chloroflexota bacterium]
MTRPWHAAALVALAALAASCTASSGGFNGRPADIYSVIPRMAEVRSLMGDSNWWAGVPSFEVRPLDAETTPAVERYSVSQEYLHLGTAEQLLVRYTVYDKVSSATSAMSSYQTNFGTSPTTPKVGDQVLYYGLAGSGGAPFVTRTFVRVGQIVVAIVWSRKERGTTVQMLARNAQKFASALKDVSKAHATPPPVDANLLPPPGLDITLLGASELPVEAFVVMILTALPDTVLALLHENGVNTFTYGDYALNNDTHMEVQTGLLKFPTSADAADWASTFGPGTPDSQGISSGYIPSGGTPAAGVYHYVFSAGPYGALIICKSSIDGEAASRECEDPVHNTAVAWKLGLGGLR